MTPNHFEYKNPTEGNMITHHLQKSNRRKYDTQTKMVSYDSTHIG